MYNYYEVNNEYNEASLEFRALSSFFDIYENKDKNIMIHNYYKEKNGKLKSDDQTLLGLMPYTSELQVNCNVDKANTLQETSMLMSASGFNVNNAVAYASLWAENPNIREYEYFGSDCTNFVSQILEAGGVQQEVYSSVYSGWWHTKTTYLLIDIHNNSHSWSVADVFCRYMGIGYTTRSHFDFSVQVSKGDFIAFDRYNDGDWDHCAFVTNADNYADDYEGGYYYDYKVAQHTTNYHEWVSSPNNGWEYMGQNATYGIIRR